MSDGSPLVAGKEKPCARCEKPIPRDRFWRKNKVRYCSVACSTWAQNRNCRARKLAKGLCSLCGRRPRVLRADGSSKTYCAECLSRKQADRLSRALDPVKQLLWSSRTRRYHLKKAYGITIADYEALLRSQNGRCAVCGCTEDDARNGRTRSGPTSFAARCFRVDHDHATGQVRGLLCGLCNTGLGALKDDPEVLGRALEYLLLHRSKNGDPPYV